MSAVGIYEAKTRFSRLVALAEEGTETSITRHGRVVARLVPPADKPKERHFDIWPGWVIADDWEEYTEEDDKLWYAPLFSEEEMQELGLSAVPPSSTDQDEAA